MNDRQLANVLAQAGFRGNALKTAFGVAKGESGGRVDAFNGNAGTGDRSYGLFQINMLGDLGPARRRQYGLARDEDLFDPVRNAKIAFRMSNGGRDWSPWSAFKNGSYQRHLAAFPASPRERATQAVTHKAGRSVIPEFDVGAELGTATPTQAKGFDLPSFDVGAFLSGKANGFASFTPPPKFEPPPPKNPIVSEVRARGYGGTTQTRGPAPPAPSPKVESALQVAKRQLGKPYVWGASSPGVGFDCSGLIEYAFEQAGIPTPGRLTTYSMRSVGRKVPSVAALKPGDWLITNRGKHVVMYTGNGQVIAAPRTGEVVQYQPLSRFLDQIVDIRRYP